MLKFAMLKKMLDTFKRIQRKRADFIQHFIKEKKIMLDGQEICSRTNFFFQDFRASCTKNTSRFCLKWLTSNI